MQRALTGLPALADDSGICVDALRRRAGRAFGALCRRAAVRTSADARNNQKLLDAARARNESQRALLLRAGAGAPCRRSAADHRRGANGMARSSTTPRGSGGFGYDPLFLDPGAGQDRRRTGAGRKKPHQPSRAGAARAGEKLDCMPMRCGGAGRARSARWPGRRRHVACTPGAAPHLDSAAAAVALHPLPVVRAQMPVLRLQFA